MKLPIWHVLLWTLFCLSVYLLLSCFLCLNVLRERSLCPVSVLRCLPLPTRPSCAVFVHINQGAVPLHSKLNMRPKALKSALEGDTLKVFMNSRSLAKVENYAILSYTVSHWINFMFGYAKWKYSMTKCPQPCTKYTWQQILVPDIKNCRMTSPSRLTVHLARVGRSHVWVVRQSCLFILYMYIPRIFVTSHLK